MQLKILCIGDVVGSPGRHVLQEAIPKLVAEHQVDCVIANCENVAGGSGITPVLFNKLLGYGIDVVTLGDHIFRRRGFIPVLEQSDRVVRPANLPSQAPGRTHTLYETASGVRVAVVSVLGRVFMKMSSNCPFAAVDQVLSSLPSDVKVIVVDMHGETTSEKVAMGWHLDGRVSVLFGTHTHIPTADDRVLPGGTAYVTDLGMTGPYDSVLGRDKKRVLSALISTVPAPFDVAEHDARIGSVLATIDSTTGRATDIRRITYCLDDGA